MNTGQCGSGRRRRSTKKTKKSRKGGAYGFGAPITVGTLAVDKVDTSTPVDSATGKTMPDPYSNKIGGRRRRSKRGSLYADLFRGGKKSRKVTRRRKMYGGVSQVLPARASAGFTGEGSRGLADYKDVGTGMPNDVVRV